MNCYRQWRVYWDGRVRAVKCGSTDNASSMAMHFNQTTGEDGNGGRGEFESSKENTL